MRDAGGNQYSDNADADVVEKDDEGRGSGEELDNAPDVGANDEVPTTAAHQTETQPSFVDLFTHQPETGEKAFGVKYNLGT